MLTDLKIIWVPGTHGTHSNVAPEYRSGMAYVLMDKAGATAPMILLKVMDASTRTFLAMSYCRNFFRNA